MKQPVADPSVSPRGPPLAKETPTDRKRRLARERQRRHREKMRRVQVDADVHPVPTDVTGKVLSPHRAQKPPAVSTPQPTPPGTKGRAPVATRASAARAVPPEQPALRRSERVGGAAAVAAQGNALAAEQAKQTRVRRAVAQVQAQESPQPSQSPPTSAQGPGALQQMKAAVKGKPSDMAVLQQQQQEQRHRQLRHHHDAQQQVQQEVTARQHQHRLQAQHNEQQRQKQRQLQQRQYGHQLLMHQQEAFVPQTHGFSAAAAAAAAQQPATASQAVQHHNEQGFGFSSQTVNSGAQTQYVTEAQRQYLQELSNPARFARITAQQQQQQRTRQRTNVVLDEAADAAAGLTALPGAVNGMHTGLTSSGAGQPSNSASPTALGMTGAQGARYANAVTASAAAGLQQHPGALVSPQMDTYAQNPNETGEERKRRLARERQRRRRRRLKGEGDGKPDADDMQRSGESGARHLAGGAGLANVTLALPAQGMQSHGQGQMGSGVAPQFEPGALASNSAIQAGLQPLHVSGVSASQDDLHSAAANRGGFSAHTLGVGGATGPMTSGGVVANMDLQRMPSNDAEVKEVPLQRETAEMRKRRLARDRQRRRRNKLKRSKLGLDPIEKSPTSSQGLKHGGDGSAGRLVENADQRMASDLDRRPMVTEGGGDSERMPIGSPGSTVFGGRGDVGQSLGFTDQGRGMRGNASMADGMGMNFTAGSNGLNLQMQVGNIGSGVQSSGGGLMHWSQGFDSEASARFAVESAVSAFRAQLVNVSQNGRTYVLQQGIMLLSGSEDASRFC